MSRLQTPVAAELRSIRMHIDADARLAAAAGGAARYFAEAAGLQNGAATDLQSAVVTACEEAFESANENQPGLDVTLTWLADRIEVAVSRKGAPVPGPHQSTGSRSAVAQALAGVDDVQHEHRDGVVVTRLTKFINQSAVSR